MFGTVEVTLFAGRRGMVLEYSWYWVVGGWGCVGRGRWEVGRGTWDLKIGEERGRESWLGLGDRSRSDGLGWRLGGVGVGVGLGVGWSWY